jgi:hypothetical protein
MEERFTWKGEIVFKGTVDQFDRLAKILENHPVKVGIPEWAMIDRHHLAGCNRIAVENLLGRDMLAKIVAGQPRVKINFIKDIRGGIRSPHLHYESDIILLDRERFKMLVGNVASALATARVDRIGDYINVIGPVNALADDPIPVS